MSSTFKSRFSRLFKCMAIVFVVMFVVRFFYGYTLGEAGEQSEYADTFFDNLHDVRKNYASEKIGAYSVSSYEKESDNTPPPTPGASAQKYEKTASIKSRSSEFDKEEMHIKQATQQFNAIIQYEQRSGNKGSRELHLIIGVNPLLFDSFYTVAQTIGHVTSREVTKTDKTNEYRQLNAKKTSLEKTLASLNELKSRSGAISDYVALHDKILEIEEQLQELGVELGNFDTQNEFCTVRISLYEGGTKHKVGVATRLKVALQWTIAYYLRLAVAFTFVALFTFLILLIIDRFKILRAIVSKVNE